MMEENKNVVTGMGKTMLPIVIIFDKMQVIYLLFVEIKENARIAIDIAHSPR